MSFYISCKCHNFTNITVCQSPNLRQNDVKNIFHPIGKVRFSHMSTDFERRAFEMCWFDLVMNEKLNLENLNATSKFVSTFPLELLRVGEKYSSIMWFKH